MNSVAVIACILLVWNPATAQVAAPDSTPPPQRLALQVIQGEGAINNIRQRSGHEPVVRVEDENGKPISGAAVAFTLPLSGASGEFSNGDKNLTVTTDSQGLASARGLKINSVAGKLPIHVNVSYRGLTARTIVMQFNMDVPGTKVTRGGGGSGKVFAILAVIGAAAAGGAYAATHKGNSSTPAAAVPSVPAIGITPGTATIGPPR